MAAAATNFPTLFINHGAYDHSATLTDENLSKREPRDSNPIAPLTTAFFFLGARDVRCFFILLLRTPAGGGPCFYMTDDGRMFPANTWKK